MKFIMFYWYSKSVSPKTVLEHVHNIQRNSKYSIDLLNIYDNTIYYNKSWLPFFKKWKVNLDIYDGCILHNTACYLVDTARSLSSKYDCDFERYRGLKILMKQDEMLRLNETIDLLDDWQFDLLLTCVPSKNIDIVYPNERLPKLKKLKVETGYVTSQMTSYSYSQDDDRSLDVIYRGMLLPYNFGSLSHDKYRIGEQFRKIAQNNKLKVDISSKIEDRIYNKAWIKFLASSKATLGVESGASIIDFKGDVEKATNSYLSKFPDASFEQVYKDILYEYDNKILYNAVSPRHFEAAATKTVQILFEGEYGGIFKPDVHYIPLKKDFSNVEEVIAQLSDIDYRKHLTENAYDEIIMSDEYSYDGFVKQFDSAIDAL
jgi:hypothetical protein